jgi:mRNA export factor
MALFGAASSSAALQNSTTVDISLDVQVPPGPEDSISDIAFSPKQEILSVASWDNKVHIYEIGSAGARGIEMYEHTGPVLATHFHSSGKYVASGSADKTAKVYDLEGRQAMQVAAHDMPIQCVKFVNTPGGEMLATASWDKMLKYWDLRSIPSPSLYFDPLESEVWG